MMSDRNTSETESISQSPRRILLVGVNAKYIHASFGLRYLYANLRELADQAEIIEFDINQRVVDMAERILSKDPSIVGVGVYIWNILQVQHLVEILKKVKPSIQIVLGGPEVSHETHSQLWLKNADFVVTGEADLTFYHLCQDLLSKSRPLPESTPEIIHSQLPDLKEVVIPYHAYTEEDVRNRIIYVEASRGCPFTCEFCLSSIDVPVRAFDLELFTNALKELFDRGVRHFKFVDRTFNLNIKTGSSILQFFLDIYETGLFLHFEMIPDRLPDALRELIRQFPKGAVQFEIGIQSFNDETAANISRRQNISKTKDNLRFLREETGVHLHVDLIVGLPGEDIKSFGDGFNQLIDLHPHEIQIGILKRLRGTPIVRHDQAFKMVYDAKPPYEILHNKDLSFFELQTLKRFARYWDLVGNSGNFIETIQFIWMQQQNPFEGFMAFSNWLYQVSGKRHGIALTKLYEYVWEFLTTQLRLNADEIAKTIWKDYRRTGRSDYPQFLRSYAPWDQDKVFNYSEEPEIKLSHLKAKRQRTHAS